MMSSESTHNLTTTTTSSSSSSTSSSTSHEIQEALALKKALEWELSLDSRDLRSHAWYHGPLTRQRAEEIVQRDGDFLIRDCTSQPDNYVLTCRSKGSVLHFVINKLLVQPETVYERVQYQFEEDAFDAIPDLITFYVGSGKSISLASGARIQYPCNRRYPLSFYGHKIVGNQLHAQMLTGLRGVSPLNSPSVANVSTTPFEGMTPAYAQPHRTTTSAQRQNSPMPSPPRSKTTVNKVPPHLPSKKQRGGVAAGLTPTQALVLSNIKNSSELLQDETLQLILNANSVADSHLQEHLQNLQLHGKIPSNGCQTIARCTAAGGTILEHPVVKFTTHSLPRPATSNTGTATIQMNRAASLTRDFITINNQNNNNNIRNGSSSLECQGIPEEMNEEQLLPPSPPPKPLRTSNGFGSLLRRDHQETQAQALAQAQATPHRGGTGVAGIYQLSGSDSGNGSGDSMPGDNNSGSTEFIMQRGVIIKNPRFMTHSNSSLTLKNLPDFDVNVVEEQLLDSLDLPEYKILSRFDLENFSTLLLPAIENYPLDGDALNTFKAMILETGPKMVAEHLTRIDIGLLIEEEEEKETELNASLTESSTTNPDQTEASSSCTSSATSSINEVVHYCGLELLTLPHGHLFRGDLLERTQCLKLMVAVTILTCPTDTDRAELLSKWIQIAVETKTALGNLFGFYALMLGLCMPEIQKLESAWHLLRQKYTDDAFMFEAKLRPTWISMNECSNPQAPNTTVPHVLLYILLKDRPILDILGTIGERSSSDDDDDDRSHKSYASLYNTCITSWETKADDFGMYINFLHLDAARGFLNNLPLFRKNARIIMEESMSRLDELLSDAFRTEFHVKFLWGSKGATVCPEERHTKLERVLGLMSNKFQQTTHNETNNSQ